jgi:hypothetical protein
VGFLLLSRANELSLCPIKSIGTSFITINRRMASFRGLWRLRLASRHAVLYGSIEGRIPALASYTPLVEKFNKRFSTNLLRTLLSGDARTACPAWFCQVGSDLPIPLLALCLGRQKGRITLGILHHGISFQIPYRNYDWRAY